MIVGFAALVVMGCAARAPAATVPAPAAPLEAVAPVACTGSSTRVWLTRTFSALAKGDDAEADRALRWVERCGVDLRDPDAPGALQRALVERRARSLAATGDFKAAEALLHRRAIEPSRQVQLWLSLDRQREAEAAYALWTELPTTAPARLERARLALALGRDEEAMAWLGPLLESPTWASFARALVESP